MLSRSPFVGFALLFIAGILVGGPVRNSIPNAYWLTLLISLSSGAGALLFYLKNKKGVTPAFWLFLIALGASCRINVEEGRDTVLASFEHADYSAYQATITSLPEKRDRSIRLEADVNRIFTKGRWLQLHSKALINLPVNATDIPRPGDILVAKGTLEKPISTVNPEQFDYRRYLRNKDILLSDQLWDNAFEINHQPGNFWSLRRWITGTSEWADRQFRANIHDNASYGLVKAMLLGRRDDLQAGQTDDYIASGTVHILSVSGMHVAIIFLLITTTLGWLKRWEYGKLLYVSIIILLLGFYALVTGFSPSVQRATIMCIVFVLAEVSGRKQHAMNTLAISALLILLFDPSALFDVGFQLSYLAMSGIFLFYQPIFEIFSPGNRIARFVWQVSALAFAAQLTTFPLSLYYFHQFPTYFWLVNPFVIAFTNVLLPVALAVLLVSITGIPWAQWLVNQVVDLSASLTNFSAAIPTKLPGYLIQDINLGTAEILLLYLAIFFAWYAVELREYKYMKYAFMTVLLFSALSVSQSIQLYALEETAAFELPKYSIGSYKHANNLYVVGGDAIVSDSHAFDFYIKNYIVSREISNVVFVGAK
jgi:competence protein ComEC